MAKRPPGAERDVADVSWLVEEALKDRPHPDQPTPSVPSPSRPAPSTAPAPAQPDPVESYAVVGGDDHGDEVASTPIVPPIRLPPSRKPRPKREDDSPRRAPPEPPAKVEQVWSRWSEWGATLTSLAIVALSEAFLLSLAISAGLYTLCLFLILLSGVVLIVLAYPIFITLERPVRITPEQAIKDYYGALSHLMPHYRRMWLLLSSEGRKSGSFSSFAGFKAYWRERRAELRGNRGGRGTLLRFEVADFQSDKSAGRAALDARFTLNVFLGDEPGKEPIRSYRTKTGLIKGPDRMWYLNKGTLPAES
ncbi:MAG: hypothetical protein JOZ53_00215 [Planctomycetaceae bacterium]|nr:hypothetical protein [Planctomycetaceae bacterium]